MTAVLDAPQLLTLALSLLAVGFAALVLREARALRRRSDEAELEVEDVRIERVDGIDARAIVTLRNIGAGHAADVRVDHRLGRSLGAGAVPRCQAIPSGESGAFTLRVRLDELSLSVVAGDCQRSTERWWAAGATLGVSYRDRTAAHRALTLPLPERGTMNPWTPASLAAVA